MHWFEWVLLRRGVQQREDKRKPKWKNWERDGGQRRGGRWRKEEKHHIGSKRVRWERISVEEGVLLYLCTNMHVLYVCSCGLIYTALSFVCVCVCFLYLFLLKWPGSLLLCQHHLSLSGDLNALPQGLLQLLNALRLLAQSVLQNRCRKGVGLWFQATSPPKCFRYSTSWTFM